ncbi:hypothetical protein SKAU_G00013760 [Synaphobranchus kaupii]|uniref:Uncharacterized protein n=1 Tax=Synaphobranchus kaupii TaxID=118154 RepID=A0A9Q1GBP1_SYNKA|nr:hypothetical protein SKAU_G00013760 [Synaphobranchus kaupii]
MEPDDPRIKVYSAPCWGHAFLPRALPSPRWPHPSRGSDPAPAQHREGEGDVTRSLSRPSVMSITEMRAPDSWYTALHGGGCGPQPRPIRYPAPPPTSRLSPLLLEAARALPAGPVIWSEICGLSCHQSWSKKQPDIISAARPMPKPMWHSDPGLCP